MKRIFRRRPSPAMVVACAALLIALGGTSIAAVTAVPNNSVGTAQLKNNAVTAAKIASNAVTAAKIANGAASNAKLAANAVTNSKIANNAVTSEKVENHSLLSVDFAPGQIPPGPPGPRGPAGTVGKLTLHSNTISVGNGNSSEASVKCPSDQQAVSGGATWSDKGDLNLTLVYSNPIYDSAGAKATGWVARGRNQTSKGRQFIVQVLCGKA